MDQIKQVAEKAARQAGALLKERLGHIKSIDYKSAFNLVTDVDRESERLVIAIIKETFPGDRILGEESGASGSTAQRRWLIDPLDGTTNYTHGYPCFAVSIGCEDSGEMIVAVVFNPIADELFWAVKGKGAYLNDRPINVSSTTTIETSLLATGFPVDTRVAEHPNMPQFQRLTDMSQGVRRDGSAAIDLCQVACGRLDGYWELTLGPWDMAAGSLLVKEAGGNVTNVLGGPFDVNKKHILASNGKLHEDLVRALDFATAFGAAGAGTARGAQQ